MHGERIARNQRGRHRLMKRLKYPKVGRGKKQKNKRTERRKVKWKDTKNKETLRHIEQEKGKKTAQERPERTCRREKPKMKSRNSRKKARIRKK